MNEVTLPHQKRKPTAQDYRNHAKSAEDFAGSDREYCRRHGLDISRFAYHKKKFREGSGFAKVEVTSSLQVIPSSASTTASALNLPDPKWVASLIRELMQ